MSNQAQFQSDMAAWHAKQKRTAKARLAYEKRWAIQPGDMPGGDKEAREACKPRGFKPAYYEGGYRMVIDGCPVRMAAHVKTWKVANRKALCQGYDALGLIVDGPRKARWTSTYEEKAVQARFWGDLFCYGPENQSRVAAGAVGEAIRETW